MEPGGGAAGRGRGFRAQISMRVIMMIVSPQERAFYFVRAVYFVREMELSVGGLEVGLSKSGDSPTRLARVGRLPPPTRGNSPPDSRESDGHPLPSRTTRGPRRRDSDDRRRESRATPRPSRNGQACESDGSRATRERVT
jgi:hypothetical protein